MQKEEPAEVPAEEKSEPTTKGPERFRKQQMAMIRLFIKEVKAGRMDRSEVTEAVYKMEEGKFITTTDVITLIRELNEVLGTTPEQIREVRIGLIRYFIQLTKEKFMDRSEVIFNIYMDRTHNSITDEDSMMLTKELDATLGITPEQIRENKIGFIRIFIQLAKDQQMERDEVLERIDQVKSNGFISEADVIMLQKELQEALGETHEN